LSLRVIVLFGLTSVLHSFLAYAQPYPPSPVITKLTWAPPSTIVRQARGSDNWPITWGDDDNIYTAYGDGWGFKPKVPSKLSLGFAKIIGPATDFHGVNIRSSTGEQKGGGKKGKKASGMLMVNGALYMWVRNANNRGKQCQLAWSTDHAKTWTWSDWKFEQFGYCTFLNFGKNYAEARDNYVYIVTHDNPSAYEMADRFILVRVPKGQITNRSAYEFFKQLDARRDPVWTPDPTQRGAVFKDPGRCYRSGISYNPALKRYFWWQAKYPRGPSERGEGGFGIFDAPEPWGPWTTVYFTKDWDVGPGETGSFPTKWMSDDGKTLYLVFSGNDSFSVRKATLAVGSSQPSRWGVPRPAPTWQSPSRWP